jgi:hypothetical protein
MKPDLPKLMTRRADLLAFLRLTDRDDLLVDRLASRQAGTDFRVAMGKGRGQAERAFRVVFEGVPGWVARPDDLHAVLDREIKGAEQSDELLPLVVFVFTMDDDQGYYGWILEPRVTPPQGLVRRRTSEICWRKLDEGGIDEIVAKVNAWYDAQRQPQAA